MNDKEKETMQQEVADLRRMGSLDVIERQYDFINRVLGEVERYDDIDEGEIKRIKAEKGRLLLEVTLAQEAEVSFYEELEDLKP